MEYVMMSTKRTRRAIIDELMVSLVLMCGVWVQPVAGSVAPTSHFTHMSIPILGLTVDQSHRPSGMVSYVVLHFQDRHDQEGLRLSFDKTRVSFHP